jgi:hypothetical protein
MHGLTYIIFYVSLFFLKKKSTQKSTSFHYFSKASFTK